jgi:hypothetical protein
VTDAANPGGGRCVVGERAAGAGHGGRAPSLRPGLAACAVAAGLVLGAPPAAAQREPGWDLRVAERIEVAAGATAPLTIALAVDRGLTVSKDAAVIVDLGLDAGISVKKKRLGRGDAVDPEADAPRFAINVRGDAPGDHVVRLRVRFWLCGTRSCRPIDVRRTATVAVAAPASSDAGANAGSDRGRVSR